MEKLLIVLAVVLGVIAVAQLAKSYELAASLRNKREEEISHADIKINAVLMLVFMFAFYIFFIWQIIAYSDVFMPPAASVHGESIDTLFDFNLWIIFIAFFLTNTLLFVFAYKYHYRPERKALYYPHNNKLELVWTVIPAIVLAAIIIYGLKTWNTIMSPASADAEVVELYSEQFKWTARYAGEDGKMGDADFNLISSTNALGIISEEAADQSLEEVEAAIADINKKLMDNEFYNLMEAKYHEIEEWKEPKPDNHHGDEHHEDHGHAHHNELHEMMAHQPEYDLSKFEIHGENEKRQMLEELDMKMDAMKGSILIDEEIAKLKKTRKNFELHKKRIYQLKNVLSDNEGMYVYGYDDQLVTGEFHLPVNKEVLFKIRSKDVIHSAYMPHFRAQMNSVPGMTTTFKMTPNKTTAEMKAQEGEDFEYILLCNKICGASHYNMQMKIIVESEEDYRAWLKKQKTFKSIFSPEAEEKKE